MRRVLAIIIFIILFCNLNVTAGHGSVQNIIVTQPWLAVITSFIGGSNVSVSSLSDFDGKNIKINKSKNKDNSDDNNEKLSNKIIAIDHNDIKKYNLNLNLDNPEVWYLYTSFPLLLSQDLNNKNLNNKNQDENFNYNLSIEAAILDPSVTPFIAQKIMTALSKWDSDNYPYYQRRLAEFQTRLSSSVLAGKQLLNGTKIYIENENLYNLFRAAGCEILDSPDDALITLIDGDIKKTSRKSSKNKINPKSKNIFEFKRPDFIDNTKGQNSNSHSNSNSNSANSNLKYNYNIDYPAFLHDQYIALWQIVSRNKGENAAK